MKRIALIVSASMISILMTGCFHSHTWVEATCASPKTCTECGEIEGEPAGHKWIEATCLTAKTCEVCGETEGDALGHKVNKWEVVKDSTCTEDGIEEGICDNCGETIQQAIPMIDHVLGDWVIVSEPTVLGNGEKTQSCTVCGQAINTEEIVPTEEEAKEIYVAACEPYDYETIARNPDEYKFKYGKYTGEIVQVIEGADGRVDFRINITKTRWGYDDTIYVSYTYRDGESRLLDGDIVTVYGLNSGMLSYESVLGATITIPSVVAAYIDLT